MLLVCRHHPSGQYKIRTGGYRFNAGDGSYYQLFHEGQAIDHVGESLKRLGNCLRDRQEVGLFEEYTRGRDVEKMYPGRVCTSGAEKK
jgi:hypothetical protein